MKKIVYYVANDGTEFNDEQACVVYENSIKRNRKKINNAIATLKEYCYHTTCCNCFAGNPLNGSCAFKESDPEEWEMEMK